MRPYFFMEEKQSDNKNKIPEKMARLAWPKAKYGFIIAIIIFLLVNFVVYKNQIFKFLSL
tara:strand:+ start:452 stop:631 length:180 start_codon:yes stop_codon:yes gene_type:complete